jgi:zinc/manganese transport system substrate-binding protein
MRTLLFLATLLIHACVPNFASAKLNVVATTPDLAAIARAVGHDHIDLQSLARPTEDPHFVDPKPSFIRLLNKADLLIEGGAELEAGWLPPLIQNARNAKIHPGAPGHFAGNTHVTLLNVATGRVNRSEGDVHPAGNPHYLLDPRNGARLATALAAKLAELDPKNGASYQRNAAELNRQVQEQFSKWESRLNSATNRNVITYHRNFDYFLEAFRFTLAGTIEPKPGVEPSPTHLQHLIQDSREKSISLVIAELNRPRKTVEQVASSLHSKPLFVAMMPESHSEPGAYLKFIEGLVTAVEKGTVAK